jgi:hypothetical protein
VARVDAVVAMGPEKKVLRRFSTTAHQYGTEFRHALQDLIIAAVRREHRHSAHDRTTEFAYLSHPVLHWLIV